jgi:hypothetical protein
MFAGISRAEKEHVLTTLEALVSDPESLERDGF